MSLLGLDIGTTGAKAIAFDKEGNELSSAYKEYRIYSPRLGWLQLNPSEVWKAIQEVIQKTAATVSNDPVEALSTSALGDAVTPVNRKGNFLDATIISPDARAIVESEEIEHCFGRQRLFELTGLPIHPCYTLNKILWFRNHRPDIFQKTYKFLSWQDLFHFKIGLDPVLDYSQASRTMAFDVVNKRWADKLLKKLGISPGTFWKS